MTHSTESATQSFLLLHGHEHHQPDGHWLVWLATELERRGQRVRYPQLPDADRPELAEWIRVIDDELGRPGPAAPTVICHSLSTVTWLHAVATLDAPVGRVLLVAPPSPRVLAAIPEIAGFAVDSFSPETVAAVAAVPTLIVAGDDDPYCPEGAGRWYGTPLAVDVILVPGAGHLDLAAGYGSWPAVLDWCLDPAASAHWPKMIES